MFTLGRFSPILSAAAPWVGAAYFDWGFPMRARLVGGWIAALAACTWIGCGDDPGAGLDASGLEDGGAGVDGGSADSGPDVDGGASDAAPPPDGSSPDGGSVSPTCGDSTVEPGSGEECDDGNTADGDGCSAGCRVEVLGAGCGNGMLEPAAREECDDGNTVSGDGCSAACQLELVGASCGDGATDAGEICDDGNLVNGDACNPTCNFANTTTLFAGSPGNGGSTDGIGTAARFTAGGPGACMGSGVLTADNTYVYVGDSGNRRVRRIEVATATVQTIAGDGVMRLRDHAMGASASFNNLEAITTDGARLWVADSCRIREILLTAPYPVTTIAGGACVAAGSPVTDGAALTATWSDLRGLTYYAGRLYSVDANAAVLRALDLTTMMVSTAAGTANAQAFMDGNGAAARFQSPRYIASDNSGMLFIADTNGARIRAFNTVTGEVTTFAGNGTSAIVDGTGTAAQIQRPRGITSDGTSVYFAEFNGATIRQGVIASQVVTTMIGTPGSAGYLEGVGSAARIDSPWGLAFHYASGSIFWFDNANCVVRRIQ